MNTVNKKAPERTEAEILENGSFISNNISENLTNVKNLSTAFPAVPKEPTQRERLNVMGTARQEKEQENTAGTTTGVLKVEPQQEQQPDYEIQSITEFLKQPKPREWLVDKWIPKTGIVFLAGESGSGKTFIALHIALTIANENKDSVFGLFCKTCPVLYINGEGYDELYYRIQGYCNEYGVPDKFQAINAPVPLDEPKLLDGIIEKIPQNGLFVIDTFSSSFAGIDDNSPKETKPIMRELQRIAKERNALIMIVHHFGKDTSKGMRGAKNLFDSADTVLYLTKNKDSIKLELRKNKRGKDHIHKDFLLKNIQLDCGENTFVVNENPDYIISQIDFSKQNKFEEEQEKTKKPPKHGSALWAMNKIKNEYEGTNKTFSTSALYDNFYEWIKVGNPNATDKKGKPKIKESYRTSFDTAKSTMLAAGELFLAGCGLFTFNSNLAKTDEEVKAEMEEAKKAQEQNLCEKSESETKQ